ncbi:MAG: OadG family protein [Prevotella sp.]|nr:OadG family protein [Prevotella sp.]MBR4521745.1 OadG family protein [Prevotella sp.]
MKRYLFTLLACGATITNALAYEGANSDIMARLKQDDPHGFGISILCMSVVFLCLALLFVFFKIFGFVADRQKKIAKVQPIKPIIQTGKKIEEVRQITKNILQDGLETKGRDKEIYIAVISMALMQYQEDVHDVESGVLTIKEHQSSWTAPQFNNM